MTQRFGDSAAQLSGAASALLGWRPNEFWNATPMELALALQLPRAPARGPDLETVEELLRRFPDE